LSLDANQVTGWGFNTQGEKKEREHEAKPSDYFLRRNQSIINQCMMVQASSQVCSLHLLLLSS